MNKFFIQILRDNGTWESLCDEYGHETLSGCKELLQIQAKEWNSSNRGSVDAYRIVDDEGCRVSDHYFYDGSEIDYDYYTSRKKGWTSEALIASAISGYSPEISSAHDQAYYDFKTDEDRKNQIKSYAENVYDIILDDDSIESVFQFLEKEVDLDNDNDRCHLFEELIEKTTSKY